MGEAPTQEASPLKQRWTRKRPTLQASPCLLGMWKPAHRWWLRWLPLCRQQGAHDLDNGPKADTWLELMK